MIKYFQTDKRWANKKYSAKAPHTETMSSSGCGPTSAAMVVANLADETVTPDVIADFSISGGHRIDGVGTAFSLFGAVAEKYNLEMEQTSSIDKATECVKTGGMVICSTNGGNCGLFSTGGHLFVLCGVSGETLIFADPYLYSGKYDKSYRKTKAEVKDGLVYVKKKNAKPEITAYFCYKAKKDEVCDVANKIKEIITINDFSGFVDALREAKEENNSLWWAFYKIAYNKKTDIPAVNTEVPDKPDPFTYHIEGTTHIIEVDPRNIWAVETQCATNKTPYTNFVNSVYFMPQKNGKVFPQGIMVNGGKVICNNATHGKPVATLIVHGENDVEMKYVSDITKEKDVWFAVSGFGVYPEITAEAEGFTGKFTDVLRCAARPIIGYRKSDNKIVIAVRDNSEAERAWLTAQNLKLDFAISLDGGGSTTLKIKDKYIFAGDGRQLFGGLTFA